MHPRRRPAESLLKVCLALACVLSCALASAQLPAQSAAVSRSVEELLRELRAGGVDVIYSSDLVPADLRAAVPAQGTPLDRARAALAAHGLTLRAVGSRYVVVRADPPAAPAAPPAEDAPLQEISVYASRYAIEGRGVAEPRELESGDIEGIPGSHDDALRALKSLPGLVSNASGRPYIRGSLSEDVLFRYDGITLLDPFHLKNFQSLISAIDPAAVDGIEVFSGGFPVRYGTRSGGVIAVAAPSQSEGAEFRAAASAISAGVSTMGRADEWPLEWLAAVRHSTLDLIDPVEDGFGRPRFSDSLGRLRWNGDAGDWTLGWLLLDDQLALGHEEDHEIADASYRDEYFWLAHDRETGRSRLRASAVVTASERRRRGTLDNPGVAAGTLDHTTDFDRIELTGLWTYTVTPASSYTLGVDASSSRAWYRYARTARYDPAIAAAFSRAAVNDLTFAVDPSVVTLALHAANRRRWDRFEAELGMRIDAQHYEPGGNHTQFSPRLNLRYDFSDRLRLYASAGRFTQAQHVEEWRVEDAQASADAAQVAVHTILGFTFESDASTRWGFEAYSKRWTTVSPYLDSQLGPLSLLPDLGPDRIRLDPRRSESSGLEVSVRQPFTERLSGWSTLSWSRVADDVGGRDVLRSWDQPLAFTAGLAWKGSRASFSALGGWHRGWPRTDFDAVAVALGPRNAERWRDFLTLDVRGSWTWPFSRGDLTVVLEATNATNRRNQCCAVLEADAPGVFTTQTEGWLPAIVNLGFSFRWRNPR